MPPYGEETSLKIRQFDFNVLSSMFGLYLILGKRDTGKTTWCRYMNTFIPSSMNGIVIVVTQNEKLKLDWAQYVPILYIFYPDDCDILDQVRNITNNIMFAAERNNLGDSVWADNTITIILDDVGTENIMKFKSLRDLAATGRHCYVNVFILAQYFIQVPTQVRTQFDYIFMMQTFSDRNIKMLHKEYISMIDMTTFKALISTATSNYGTLVLKTGARTAHVEDVCFFARIPPSEVGAKVRFGKKEQWEFSDRYYFEHSNRVDLCHAKNPWSTQQADVQFDEDDDDGYDDCGGVHRNRKDKPMPLEIHTVQSGKRKITIKMLPSANQTQS